MSYSPKNPLKNQRKGQIIIKKKKTKKEGENFSKGKRGWSVRGPTTQVSYLMECHHRKLGHIIWEYIQHSSHFAVENCSPPLMNKLFI